MKEQYHYQFLIYILTTYIYRNEEISFQILICRLVRRCASRLNLDCANRCRLYIDVHCISAISKIILIQKWPIDKRKKIERQMIHRFVIIISFVRQKFFSSRIFKHFNMHFFVFLVNKFHLIFLFPPLINCCKCSFMLVDFIICLYAVFRRFNLNIELLNLFFKIFY